MQVAKSATPATVASNGFEGTTEGTAFWAGAEVTAKDEGDKWPADWWWWHFSPTCGWT